MNELIQILLDVKDKWGQETVQAIIKKIDSYPIRWQGTLRRSISYEQDDTLDGDITFNMADYGKFIDEGVNGSRSVYTTAYQFKGNYKGTAYHLTSWANSKGLNRYAVARSIQKKGIKPRPFFNSVIQQRVDKDLPKLIETAYNDYLNKSIEDFNNDVK